MINLLGAITRYGFAFDPEGWVLCDGRSLSISEYPELFDLIKTKYGGDGTSHFCVPKLLEFTKPEPIDLNNVYQEPEVTLVDGHFFEMNGELMDLEEWGMTIDEVNAEIRERNAQRLIPEEPQPITYGSYFICVKGTHPSHYSDDEMYLGMLQAFAFDMQPQHFLKCEGQILKINDNQALFSLLGNKFGGDGRLTFALPDFRGAKVVGVSVNYYISKAGQYPSRDSYNILEAYTATIVPNLFSFVPSGFKVCDGAMMSLSNNTALYSLLGTNYGGNGSTDFAIPNLEEEAITLQVPNIAGTVKIKYCMVLAEIFPPRA